jgi:hypothetical protein
MSELEVTPDGKLIPSNTLGVIIVGYACGWQLTMNPVKLDREDL